MTEEVKETEKPKEAKQDVPFNVLVEQLEKDVQLGDKDPLELVLQALVDAANALKDAGLRHRGVSDASIAHYYTRFASVITQVITSYDKGISLLRYESICWRKQDVSYIFAVSGYRGMAHLVNLCSSRNEDGTLSLTKNRALLLLAFLDIDHLTGELLDFALTQDPQIVLPLMVGWLSQRTILTERGEANRTKILQSGHLIEGLQIEDRHLPMISVAYMYVTYAVFPGKHDFKRSLNKLCRNLLERRSLEPKDLGPPKRKKPRLLVIHEWFSHSHAMYRCYAPLIAALGKKFEIHSLASNEGIDAEAAKMFKSSTVVDPLKIGIPGILREIGRLNPDAIFYPSVGMAYWVILLSNLRLAPVQFASQGHPASTRSDYIDFIFCWRPGFKDFDIYSEEVVVGQSAPLFFPHKSLSSARPNPKYSIATSEINVAVNSKVMKINWQIISICKKLVEQSRLPIKFHFFPGERGWSFDGIRQSIQTHLPEAEIYPLMQYEQLLERISLCDFSLSPMPFGNTNSIIDCALLGVPTVCPYGKEVATQTDAIVYETIRAPEGLIAHSIEQYLIVAERLCNDLAFRLNMRQSFNRDEAFAALYERAPDDRGLSKDVEEIYAKYEELINRGPSTPFQERH